MDKLVLKGCQFGKGVFAIADINTGDEVLQFGGSIVSEAELPWPYTPEKDHYLQIGDGIFLGPSGELDDYVNHSCNPNTGVVFSSNEIRLVAITPISADSEITFDYSSTMDSLWGEMECACGSENCRRKVKNFVDLPIEIQIKYIELGVVADFLLQKLTEFNPGITQACLAKKDTAPFCPSLLS